MVMANILRVIYVKKESKVHAVHKTCYDCQQHVHIRNLYSHLILSLFGSFSQYPEV